MSAKTITVERFRQELRSVLSDAVDEGEREAVVVAGDIHKRVADPSRTNRMPACCEAMMDEFNASTDEIVESPPSRQGPGLTIRYRLPRRR